jgi:hypothetical protein
MKVGAPPTPTAAAACAALGSVFALAAPRAVGRRLSGARPDRCLALVA